MATFNFEKTIERDIDRIICEELYCSQDFFNIFLSKIGVKEGEIVSIEHSKFEDTTDENGTKSRGESDVEVVYKSNGTLHGLLIENKISAAPQPRQAERYRERGNKYVAEERIVDYQTCIVAPEKYLTNDIYSADKYDLRISYKDLILYFKKSRGTNYEFKRMCFEAAEVKQKFSSRQLHKDRPRDTFVIEYVEYLESFKGESICLKAIHEPEGDKKPNWFTYKSAISKSYIHHKCMNKDKETKQPMGFVDIVLTGRTKNNLGHINEVIKPYVKRIENLDGVEACVPEKSQVVIRKKTKPIFNDQSVANQKARMNEVFNAIVKMIELSEALQYTDI